jgi:hypothetical protein
MPTTPTRVHSLQHNSSRRPAQQQQQQEQHQPATLPTPRLQQQQVQLRHRSLALMLLGDPRPWPVFTAWCLGATQTVVIRL